MEHLIVLKGNQSIATFENRGFSMGTTSDFKDGLPYKLVIQLKYHRSWDWLMPIVVEIRKSLTGHVQKGTFLHEGRLNSAILNVDINSAWKEVVWFTNWFNKRNK